jgi:hypothetical protein
MTKGKYCDVLDVCAFLSKHRPQFTSFGIQTELVHGKDGQLVEAPALKPTNLFRGQTKAYATLRPSIYRIFPPVSTWQETQTVRIEADSLVMPHPHYSADLERDFYFSCVKATELIRDVARLFPEFPGEQINGHALCQHYGLPTHFLDFSENVWIAGFFASHSFRNGAFEPCSEGIGVMYVLETEQVPDGQLYEIGIQPLPRPFAQRGWLLRVPPEVNLLAHSSVWAIHFQHSADASATMGKHFGGGQDLLPIDKISEYLESRLSERTVSKVAIDDYLHHVPSSHRPSLRASINRLFDGSVCIV